MNNTSGFINIIKPTGMTSSDVVVKVKKILQIKKVGHLGTLDPAASGVLPIAVGKATKFFDYFLSKDKVYYAIGQFGVLTDTLDAFGKILKTDKIKVNAQDIEIKLSSFTGKIEQIPPIYSAVKVNGKKACDLARNGENVDIMPRKIEIYDFDLISDFGENRFLFKIHCSAGTYIRTLINDLAQSLNTVATTTCIIRSKSGQFELKDAITLEDFEQSKKIYKIEEVLSDIQIYDVDFEIAQKLINGVKICVNDLNQNVNDLFFVKHNGQIVGLYQKIDEKIYCLVYLYSE